MVSAEGELVIQTPDDVDEIIRQRSRAPKKRREPSSRSTRATPSTQTRPRRRLGDVTGDFGGGIEVSDRDDEDGDI